MTSKVIVKASSIQSATNAQTFENEYKGNKIVTNEVNIPMGDVISIESEDKEASAYVGGLVNEFTTKDGQPVKNLRIKLGEGQPVKIYNKQGQPLELSGNIQETEKDVKLIVAVGRDKTFNNLFARVNAIIFNVDTADEINIYSGIDVEDTDFDF